MSHDRGCPCGKERGDDGYRECKICKPRILNTKETTWEVGYKMNYNKFKQYYLVWWVEGGEKSPEESLMGIHSSKLQAEALRDKIKASAVARDGELLYITSQSVSDTGETY